MNITKQIKDELKTNIIFHLFKYFKYLNGMDKKYIDDFIKINLELRIKEIKESGFTDFICPKTKKYYKRFTI